MTYKFHRSSPAGEELLSTELTLKPLLHILPKPVLLISEATKHEKNPIYSLYSFFALMQQNGSNGS